MSLKAYNEQRHNAKRRDIQFLFTYEEWINWWTHQLGPDWQQMRGRTKGKYCMARYGDTGAYEPKNVKCIRHADNVTDAAANDTIAFGQSAGRSVLSDENVREIFVSREKIKDLANKHGISIGTIIDIRTKRTWKRLTKSLKRKNLRNRSNSN